MVLSTIILILYKCYVVLNLRKFDIIYDQRVTGVLLRDPRGRFARLNPNLLLQLRDTGIRLEEKKRRGQYLHQDSTYEEKKFPFLDGMRTSTFDE